MKKLTIDDVKNYLLLNDTNQDCTLLSTTYVNSKASLKFQCNACGEEFERSFQDVKRNAKFTCARCSQGRYLTIQQVQNYLNEHDINNDCTLLSTQYKNYYTPLKFQCNACGEIFTRTFAQVKQNGHALKCYNCLKKQQGGYNKKTIEDVQNFIDQYDLEHDCELLSTTYVDQYTPLLFKCNCCGKEFERTYFTLKSKKAFKCFRCAHHLPEEIQTDIYNAVKNHFRAKLYAWKKDALLAHPTCDITGTTQELDIHHLISFSTILHQASLNTGVPLNIRPQELATYGYSLEALEHEFMRLHTQLGSAVVLTQNIHQLFHNLYGYKNNTPEQYAEFKEKYQKGELKQYLCTTG